MAGYTIKVDGHDVDTSSGITFSLPRPASSLTVEAKPDAVAMTWKVGDVEVIKVPAPVAGTVYDITNAFNATTANSGTIS